MQKLNHSVRTLITFIFLVMFTVGCQQDNASSVAGPDIFDATATPELTLDKKKDKGDADESYSQSGSVKLTYKSNWPGYKKGQINLGQGSKMTIPKKALTPPPGTPLGDDVTITMSVDYDAQSNELNFEFGPHGSTFDPPVELRLRYSELGNQIPYLYYIDEDGNYIEQTPDDVDIQGQFVILYLHHFSRYALSHGRW